MSISVLLKSFRTLVEIVKLVVDYKPRPFVKCTITQKHFFSLTFFTYPLAQYMGQEKIKWQIKISCPLKQFFLRFLNLLGGLHKFSLSFGIFRNSDIFISSLFLFCLFYRLKLSFQESLVKANSQGSISQNDREQRLIIAA